MALRIAALTVAGFALGATSANAQDAFYSGDWSLTLGAAVIYAPDYEGADDYNVFAQPLVSFGRQGTQRRFTSRNDNISIGLIDTGTFRAGPTGKLVFPRDDDDSDDLIGLGDVEFGAEIGAFAEFYPTNWLRLRGELRHGIRAHDGLVGDVAVDAFTQLTPTLRLSGGPRATWASSDYFDAYYGVSPIESAISGLAPYTPDSGFASVGVGGALTWKATDVIETSLFAEYKYLTGPASDSSLVEERGDRNQFLIGVSATYRFDFSL